MLIATQGLVLHTTAYSESSVIAKIFTRQMGVRTYILKGVRKGGARIKQNLLQPLSSLDLVVYNNPKTQINYIKEIAPHVGLPASAAPQAGQAIRNALLFFMTELLYKSMRDDEPNEGLFDYVLHAIEAIQSGQESNFSQFPLVFMLSVSRHLGIEPLDNYSVHEPFFGLSEGRFLSKNEANSTSILLNGEQSSTLHYFLEAVQQHTPCPITPLKVRTDLINQLLEYYQIHSTDFRDFKSHEILHTLLA